ncbi:hypothetical protein LZ198_07335 [Myxococcus sp. K15C18031901]|uniref:hypothetical protein n=1 Tax=Myxococcus dinghuensis TaxID=2906761 RepID=UPI0020A776CF|nr:hypothetical protein [Myxococcus dinghuensis]MCP3098688.1 hypothetical protein [Myxococcus dinghuensis]
MKCALGLAAALGVVACGDSTDEVGDKYQGVVDATNLDAKFKPTSGVYRPVTGKAKGTSVPFYNLGQVATERKDDKGAITNSGVPVDESGRPILPASRVVATSYDLADGCKTGKADFDRRTDDYPETTQWPLFGALPLAVTGNTTPPVLPLMKVTRWSGTGGEQCNAIKDVSSLTKGNFGGAASEETTVALRAIIDVSAQLNPLRTGSGFAAQGGWYRGLQLAFLDGGTVPVDAAGNLKVMEGVLVSPPTGAPATETAVYLFSALPGEEGWSPVVRLRTFTATAAKPASSYTGLCVDACAETELDITPINRYSGVLFVVGSTL